MRWVCVVTPLSSPHILRRTAVARVVVDVMLKPEILDPQGQAVANALPRLGVSDVASVRIGRRVEIEFSGEVDLERAREIADKLLANPVIEDYVVREEQ
jgi:phosphoribosylformylglycinamidine synthase PurS subunit